MNQQVLFLLILYASLLNGKPVDTSLNNVKQPDVTTSNHGHVDTPRTVRQTSFILDIATLFGSAFIPPNSNKHINPDEYVNVPLVVDAPLKRKKRQLGYLPINGPGIVFRQENRNKSVSINDFQNGNGEVTTTRNSSTDAFMSRLSNMASRVVSFVQETISHFTSQGFGPSSTDFPPFKSDIQVNRSDQDTQSPKTTFEPPLPHPVGRQEKKLHFTNDNEKISFLDDPSIEQEPGILNTDFLNQFDFTLPLEDIKNNFKLMNLLITSGDEHTPDTSEGISNIFKIIHNIPLPGIHQTNTFKDEEPHFQTSTVSSIDIQGDQFIPDNDSISFKSKDSLPLPGIQQTKTFKDTFSLIEFQGDQAIPSKDSITFKSIDKIPLPGIQQTETFKDFQSDPFSSIEFQGDQAIPNKDSITFKSIDNIPLPGIPRTDTFKVEPDFQASTFSSIEFKGDQFIPNKDSISFRSIDTISLPGIQQTDTFKVKPDFQSSTFSSSEIQGELVVPNRDSLSFKSLDIIPLPGTDTFKLEPQFQSSTTSSIAFQVDQVIPNKDSIAFRSLDNKPVLGIQQTNTFKVEPDFQTGIFSSIEIQGDQVIPIKDSIAFKSIDNIPISGIQQTDTFKVEPNFQTSPFSSNDFQGELAVPNKDSIAFKSIDNIPISEIQQSDTIKVEPNFQTSPFSSNEFQREQAAPNKDSIAFKRIPGTDTFQIEPQFQSSTFASSEIQDDLVVPNKDSFGLRIIDNIPIPGIQQTDTFKVESQFQSGTFSSSEIQGQLVPNKDSFGFKIIDNTALPSTFAVEEPGFQSDKIPSIQIQGEQTVQNAFKINNDNAQFVNSDHNLKIEKTAFTNDIQELPDFGHGSFTIPETPSLYYSLPEEDYRNFESESVQENEQFKSLRKGGLGEYSSLGEIPLENHPIFDDNKPRLTNSYGAHIEKLKRSDH